MVHRNVFWVLVLTLVACASLAWAAEPKLEDISLLPTVPRYGRQTLRFQLIYGVENPYDADEIAIDGIFTAPSGRTKSVPAFFYEQTGSATGTGQKEHGWELRFTPEEVGGYLVRVFVYYPNRQSCQAATLSFQCDPSARTGFIERAGRRFALSSGDVFFPVGANRCWGDVREPALYLEDMERLAGAGANCVRIWLAPWWLPIEREPGVFDQTSATLLDAIVTRAEELGLRIILCIEQHGNLQRRGDRIGLWPGHPYNSANGGPCRRPVEFFAKAEARRLFKNRLRYLVARWGYSISLMAWDLFNEIELVGLGEPSFQKPPPALAAWHVEMAEFLRQRDPFGHLITTSSDVQFQRRLLDEQAIDLLQLHIYEESGLARMIANSLCMLAEEISVPLLVGEYGTIHSAEEGRAVTRGIFVAAMAGLGSGALPWLQDIANPEALYPRFAAAQRFFERAGLTRDRFKTVQRPIQVEVTLRRDEHRPEHVTTLEVLSLESAKTLLVFAFSDDGLMRTPDIRYAKITIPVHPPGTYSVEVWNPESGKVITQKTVTANNGALAIELSEGPADLALIVERKDVIRRAPKPRLQGDAQSF